MTLVQIHELETALRLETIYDKVAPLSQENLDLLRGVQYCTLTDSETKIDRAKTLLRRAATEAASL